MYVVIIHVWELTEIIMCLSCHHLNVDNKTSKTSNDKKGTKEPTANKICILMVKIMIEVHIDNT